jgi:hypothetical protein
MKTRHVSIFEKQRWLHGPFCPHCGNADPEKIHKLQGKSHRPRTAP